MAKQTGSYYLKAARNPVWTCSRAKAIIGRCRHRPPTGQYSTMICPENLKGDGTEHSIRKWLLKMGVLLALIIPLVLALLN